VSGGSKLGLAVAGTAMFFVVLAMLILMPILHPANACTAGAATQPGVSKTAQNSIPGNYLKLYQSAGQASGIPWNVLAGIGKVETDHGRLKAAGVTSGANPWGAAGPMQFGIGGAAGNTWGGAPRHPSSQHVGQGVDGNHDGWDDVYDPADAIPAAAGYLKQSGAPKDLHHAIWTYNHSEAYIQHVLGLAKQYGGGGYTVAGDNTAGAPCPAGGAAGGGPATLGDINGSVPLRIVAYASKWLGTAYQFGGGDNNRPTVGTNSNGSNKPGFDCSGLTKYAVYQATNGQISLDHYVPNQWDDPHVHKVPYNQLQPGDLIAMHGWGHEGIYIGGGKMIHAPHTGDVVKISDITSGWYRNVFITGGRVIP
jgi:cell wall-associated NlpC family hydrolase